MVAPRLNCTANSRRRDAERASIRFETFAAATATLSGAVLVFLVFVVSAAEIAIAIPIVLLLSRQRKSLDVGAYSELKG